MRHPHLLLLRLLWPSSLLPPHIRHSPFAFRPRLAVPPPTPTSHCSLCVALPPTTCLFLVPLPCPLIFSLACRAPGADCHSL